MDIIFSVLPINTKAKYLLTDSRTVIFPNESIFFAIKGVRNDGHQYLNSLYLKGVREFVVESDSCNERLINIIGKFENCTFWKVENAILALQNLVAFHRNRYQLPIIGITGSNGKTIVKEWLAQVLSNKFIIVKNPKSYNSQLGVPLSVWQINESHTLGIFEAGISQPNEMENLANVIKPSIGVFTNIGNAHSEYFENETFKIKEKLKLFIHAKKIFYCADNKIISNELEQYVETKNQNCELVSWAFNNSDSTVKFTVEKYEKATEITYTNQLNYDECKLNINFSDQASIENICHCIVIMRNLNFEWSEIQMKLDLLRPVSMRLELKIGINDTYLIDDTYNNDLAGLKLAIDFMMQQKQHENKILILSDLLQSGINETDLYAEISNILTQKNIFKFVGIGRALKRNESKFGYNASFYENTESFLDSNLSAQFKNAIILIKGARAFTFEKIIQKLQLKTHETVLEINLDAVAHNFNYFKQQLGPKTRIMAMVKAFAYGAGNLEIANLLAFQNVDYLGVAYTDEGVQLRQSGIGIPIMVMNSNVNDFNKIIEYSLEPEMYSLQKLNAFCEFMEMQSGIAKIHIKIDTGMHRLGFVNEDISEIVSILRANPNIIVASIFSHLAAADNPDFDEFTESQIKQFENIANNIADSIGYIPLMHVLNTAGISRFSNYKMDMVRLGVGLYGVGNTVKDKANLILVGTLKTQISQVKIISKGQSVGYGRVGKVEHQKKIATIAIGYADGYNRRFGNGIGKVLVDGVLCPTIGNICMDMTMVDITETNAIEGQEVVLFGQNPTIYELAEQTNTIPYEILTNIGERVKRIFFKDGN